jgi:hypothetical protein
MFTSFKQDPGELASRVAAVRKGYVDSGRAEAFEAHAVRVIADRLRRRPQSYVEFGPWWWSVKRVLAEAGEDFGQAGDPMVAVAYTAPDAVSVLVAAEAFKDFYRAVYIEGTSTFYLTDDDEPYELADPDMQERVGR